jgi:putative tryptophan/tyrosine transport system substrate-binding protein
MDQIRMLVGGDWPYSALLLPHRLTPGAADGAKSRAAADLDTFGVHDQHRKGGTMRPRQVTFLLMIVLGGMTPLIADAQAPTKVARIGWMSRGNPTAKDQNMEAFRQGMRELGYVEGQTFVMEPRYAAGKSELMPEQALELERSGVDVIIAGPFEALVATGVVKSLDRPGGTITGITAMVPELTPQRLQLLKQVVPTMSRMAIL